MCLLINKKKLQNHAKRNYQHGNERCRFMAFASWEVQYLPMEKKTKNWDAIDDCSSSYHGGNCCLAAEPLRWPHGRWLAALRMHSCGRRAAVLGFGVNKGAFSLRAITKDAPFLHASKKFTRTLVP